MTKIAADHQAAIGRIAACRRRHDELAAGGAGATGQAAAESSWAIEDAKDEAIAIWQGLSAELVGWAWKGRQDEPGATIDEGAAARFAIWRRLQRALRAEGEGEGDSSDRGASVLVALPRALAEQLAAALSDLQRYTIRPLLQPRWVRLEKRATRMDIQEIQAEAVDQVGYRVGRAGGGRGAKKAALAAVAAALKVAGETLKTWEKEEKKAGRDRQFDMRFCTLVGAREAGLDPDAAFRVAGLDNWESAALDEAEACERCFWEFGDELQRRGRNEPQPATWRARYQAHWQQELWRSLNEAGDVAYPASRDLAELAVRYEEAKAAAERDNAAGTA